MKELFNDSESIVLSRLIVTVVVCIFSFGVFSNKVMAEIETSFLFNLSNFSGPIPYSWANVSIDQDRNEIYVVDTRERDISVFNSYGMEIYRFGADGNLGSVLDVAVIGDGNLLVLSRVRSGSSVILVCNFRGERVSELKLKDFPTEFSGFAPTQMICRDGRLYLLDSLSMRIAVTDEEGLFLKDYDLGALLGVEEEKKVVTEIGGFSVDRRGNMLFTVPVFFSAYKLSPNGEIAAFGKAGSAPGRFNVVGGIVADNRGYYYVADRLKSAVLIFNEEFKFQKEFGYRGLKPENLIGPNQLAFDAEGRLYVSQLKSRGVSVFKITY